MERKINLTPEQIANQQTLLSEVKDMANKACDTGSNFLHLDFRLTRSLLQAFDLPISPEIDQVLTSNISSGHSTWNAKGVSEIKNVKDLGEIAAISWAVLAEASKTVKKLYG